MPDRQITPAEERDTARLQHVGIRQTTGQLGDRAGRGTQLIADRIVLAAERTYAAWLLCGGGVAGNATWCAATGAGYAPDSTWNPVHGEWLLNARFPGGARKYLVSHLIAE